jgi:hypothetical protein
MRTCCRSRVEWCGRRLGCLWMPRCRCCGGFARVEAVALLFIMLVMAALLLASGSYERRTAMLNRDLANLRQIGAWTFAYANDFEDRHPSFSSAPNVPNPDLRALASGTPMKQAVGQAVDIIRRITGRHQFPVPFNWVPHAFYTHLVLADYARRDLPDTTFVSTGDKYRLNWLDDPINKYDNGFWQPFQTPESGSVPGSARRWPYSASFQTPPAWWDRSITGFHVSQSTHMSYSVPSGAVLGGQNMSNAVYPAQKVMLHDHGSWHVSRTPRYFAYEGSAVTVLMGDGAAALRVTSDSNVGWNPRQPSSARATVFAYFPSKWEPPVVDVARRSDRYTGHYRWTRGGIRGRDFDGPEVDTGQR